MGTQFRMCLAYQTVGFVVQSMWIVGCLVNALQTDWLKATPTECELLSISNTKASFYFYIVKNTNFSSCEKCFILKICSRIHSSGKTWPKCAGGRLALNLKGKVFHEFYAFFFILFQVCFALFRLRKCVSFSNGNVYIVQTLYLRYRVVPGENETKLNCCLP